MNAKTLVVLLAAIACAFAFSETSHDSSVPSAVCREPLVTGPCKAYKPQYGYNNEEKRCVRFIYGGCQGNDNRFKTLEECQKACNFREE
ncbi:trypsin inhibitor [Harpegnathos saltator]|uniref:WAP, kazal, immunoglobulin, kunitz and NTR domain-containing protein 2 n=1 Tax=Harpegnathos saltator TaxID=610380 RepID=E2BB26_HARSA|nr:trypsin inhibitor [Harpegnathos saltator]EFN87117.1 WAP, kazal, immunoglobulin, kunitz and NTR domain-containing protein 2 [Harpegnathos saltator]